MFRNSFFLKFVSVFLIVQITLNLFLPIASYALTSGPSQPEFSSFEPVATTNMVNEFTGDFTYNLPLIEVPGPHGSGYPLSLSYHSGVTPEEEASWVGYGWTLNPGAINRNTRGIPDDFDNQQIKYWNKTPKNWTVSVGAEIAPEIFGKDKPKPLSASAAIRYNNYRGFGYNAGIGLALGNGLVSIGYNVSDGSRRLSYSLNLSPATLLAKAKSNADAGQKAKVGAKKQEALWKTFTTGNIRPDVRGSIQKALSRPIFSLQSHAESSFPTTLSPYTGSSWNFTIGFNGTIPIVPVGVSGNVSGSYSQQVNQESINAQGYGYMYGSNSDGNGKVMDYTLEKESEFNKRDVFLGIPFNGADNFIVSGESAGGGFRLFHKNVGQFIPNKVSSSTNIFQLGVEVNGGPLLFGGGADIGIGKHTLEMKSWNQGLSNFSKPNFTQPAGSAVDEPIFFRFNNDLGGEWGGHLKDDPVRAELSGTNVTLNPAITSGNNNQRSDRSSYIGYRTNGELSSSPYKAFSRNPHLVRQGSPGLIGEIAVFDTNGGRSVFGQPVYSKNEMNLSYGLQGVPGSAIKDNYLVYHKDSKTQVGEEINSAYATTYLLTEVTNNDYIDKTNNGPTQDDLGGYTRFNYTKALDNFHWRIPYNGLRYSKNSHSDPLDDLGTVSEGDKEIYYLESIETKSHVAFFILKSTARSDGKSAPTGSIAITSTSSVGTSSLKALDRIELYAMADLPATGGLVNRLNGSIPYPSGLKPIKTVKLEYETVSADQLCKSTPNAGVGLGKLTLKRVYFEYNGIVKSKISPYIFEYKYPAYASYPAKYRSGGTDDVTVGYSSLIENPDYSHFISDAWGNYQAGGQARFTQMRDWLNQSTVIPSGFDPAAWNLKVIKLPSGGEIHVQYEQDDYAFVQDQPAHAFVNLKSSDNGQSNTFNIDLASSFGVLQPSEIDRIERLLRSRYLNTGNKIYFKIFYRLLAGGSFDLTSCNGEFVTGYATVTAINRTGSDISLVLKPTDNLPKDVCVDFVKTNRLGKTDPNASCDPSRAAIQETSNAEQLVRQLLSLAGGVAIPSSLCGSIDPVNSYFRIPIAIGKKGGGIRVKRLMMFDGGLESNPVLYGSEYMYKTKDAFGTIISSGVATNEPATVREENILVDFIARRSQSFINKIISGEDTKQAEGPLGESIYPGPSVGYSKVTIRNIHSGKTNPGFSVSEYYTCNDFPIVARMTDIRTKFERQMRPLVLATFVKDKSWATQGFSFILNDMHGQVKRQATYAGPYTDVFDLGKSTLVSEQLYEYFKPGDLVPVQQGTFGEVKWQRPGREVDISFGQKMVEEKSYDGNLEIDFSVGVIPLFFFPIVIPYPTVVPSFKQVDGGIATHSTSKVVRYPAIVKKVRSYQDGIFHTTENLAFDQATGKPTLVKSFDELKGAYLAQEFPAHWEYPNFGAKARTEEKVIKSGSALTISASSNTLTLTGAESCAAISQFSTGDLLDFGGGKLYHIASIDYGNLRVGLVPSSEATSVVSGSVTELVILESGRNNQLSQVAGSVTFHNENAASLGFGNVSMPNNQRWITGGTSLTDGSKFVSDLNTAFSARSSSPMPGPYENMNITQFGGIPDLTNCGATLESAKIRNVVFVFEDQAGQVLVKLGRFEIECSPGTWVMVDNN
jgi:hypothetical protein